MLFSAIHRMPSGVYVSGVKSVVKKRSLLSRREAIRMKMRKAVAKSESGRWRFGVQSHGQIDVQTEVVHGGSRAFRVRS
jgi:hypothetical protein